jgi:Na+-driven multidrug efflux pump
MTASLTLSIVNVAFVNIPFTYLLVFGSESIQPLENPLVAIALGYTASTAFALLLNFLSLFCVWGKELSFGDALMMDSDKVVSRRASISASIPSPHLNYVRSPTKQAMIPSPRSKNPYFQFNDGRAGEVRTFPPPPYPSAAEKSSVGAPTDYLKMTDEASPEKISAENIGIVLVPSNNDSLFILDDDDDKGLSVLNWKRWKVYFRQAVPYFSFSACNYIAYFIISMLASNLGPVDVAVNSFAMMCLELSWATVRGMSEGTTIRVGYHVGRLNVRGAVAVGRIATIFACIFGFSLGSLGYFCSNLIANLLSEDPQVIKQFVQLAPLLWVCFIIFTCGSQASAVLQGQGRSSQQASGFLLGMWLVAVPFSFVSFYVLHWGLNGLWFGLVGGFSVGGITSYMFACFKTDWDQILEDGKINTCH